MKLVDCGNDYDIAHGNADFSEQATTFNSKVPVTCYKGFDIIGVDHITCQADGNWSQDSSCQIKGISKVKRAFCFISFAKGHHYVTIS